MKTVAATLLLLLATLSLALAAPPTITALGAEEQSLEADHCLLCLKFSEKYLEYIADIISGSGVAGTCAELCKLLNDKVHNTLVEVVCDGLCDAVGIAVFVELVKKADLDPFYFCELLRECPVKNDGDAHILSLAVKPGDVKQNSTFEVEMYFNSERGTGLGQLDLTIDTVDKVPFVDDETVEPLGSGEYRVTWDYRAKPDPGCKTCEKWLPGNYTLHVSFCYGECGSRFPHSKVYDKAQTNFTVVA